MAYNIRSFDETDPFYQCHSAEEASLTEVYLETNKIPYKLVDFEKWFRFHVEDNPDIEAGKDGIDKESNDYKSSFKKFSEWYAMKANNK